MAQSEFPIPRFAIADCLVVDPFVPEGELNGWSNFIHQQFAHTLRGPTQRVPRAPEWERGTRFQLREVEF